MNRREWLRSALLAAGALRIPPALAGRTGAGAAARDGLPAARPADRFLLGASIYPELQTRAETRAMLERLARAHINVVRVGEGNWDAREPSVGRYQFDDLAWLLDELQRRDIRAVIGTPTFVPPRWLVTAHPDMLVQVLPGVPVSTFSRKSACITHPAYRAASRRYAAALGAALGRHPSIIGWQLDNEISVTVTTVCYNPACQSAWHRWLRATYHDADGFNRRLLTVAWGTRISSLDEVPLPTQLAEGNPGFWGPLELASSDANRQRLPALSLAHLHFRRDTIFDFLGEQAAALRGAGAQQPLMTDWNEHWFDLADDPRSGALFPTCGLNSYYPSTGDTTKPDATPWQLDLHRSCAGTNAFWITETRVGIESDPVVGDPAPTREQFRMWSLLYAAFGAAGIFYWSANRFRAGNWPDWGGLLDWSGRPEPELAWVAELGDLLDRIGPALLAHPVAATAAVVTDFDQRAALAVYPHVPQSRSIVSDTFATLHRLGVGTDTVGTARLRDPASLRGYRLIVLAAVSALDDPAAIAGLGEYLRSGGTVLVTPVTEYVNRDGVFHADGFGASLAPLTGALVRSMRWLGSTSTGRTPTEAVWTGLLAPGRGVVGMDGFCERLEVDRPSEIVARFASDQSFIDGEPAATLRASGSGQSIKLAFWPDPATLERLFRQLLPPASAWLGKALPPGLLGVPRADDSFFIVNTTRKAETLALARASTDRLSGRRVAPGEEIAPYGVLWLEAG